MLLVVSDAAMDRDRAAEWVELLAGDAGVVESLAGWMDADASPVVWFHEPGRVDGPRLTRGFDAAAGRMAAETSRAMAAATWVVWLGTDSGALVTVRDRYGIAGGCSAVLVCDDVVDAEDVEASSGFGQVVVVSARWEGRDRRRARRSVRRLGRRLGSAAAAPSLAAVGSDADSAIATAARQAAVEPLIELLADNTCEEYHVFPAEMWVRRASGVTEATSPWATAEELIDAVRFLAGHAEERGHRFDNLQPRLDVRIEGWRGHAEGFDGVGRPSLVLRSNIAATISLEELGVADTDLSAFLAAAVGGSHRANMVVAGGFGSGKTLLTQALLRFQPFGERLDTVEDTIEIAARENGLHQFTQQRVTVDANPEGIGAITMSDHIRDAKRSGTDKIVVGEVRGPGTQDLLDAMSSGLRGCVATLHAPQGGIVEKLVAYACKSYDGQEGLPDTAARQQIALAVDVLVFMDRRSDGTRVIGSVEQVTGFDQTKATVETLTLWQLSGGGQFAVRVADPVGHVGAVYQESLEAGGQDAAVGGGVGEKAS